MEGLVRYGTGTGTVPYQYHILHNDVTKKHRDVDIGWIFVDGCFHDLTVWTNQSSRTPSCQQFYTSNTWNKHFCVLQSFRDYKGLLAVYRLSKVAEKDSMFRER